MHKYFMLAALEQAWLGRGSCAPNPSVGAVAVHKGEIIARAWHQGAGTAHAEQLVLQQIPSGMQDISLYVTLEPCNHWGRTPPCVTAIIKYGISQVVYGYKDPNPLVAANNTTELLEAKGIEVLNYPLEDLTVFYQSYNHWTLTKTPWVTAKLAQSLDGKIAGAKGRRCYLSNVECAEFTHLNRLHTDVILTTAQTIKLDDPLLNARLQDREEAKYLAIIDSRLSIDRTAKLFTTAKHCHIYHDELYKVDNPYPNCSYHAVASKNGLLDLTKIINHLGYLGFHDVWVEAGGQLFSALHRENLVQRTYLYMVPTLLGNEAIPAFTDEGIFKPNPKVSWQIKADNVIACLDWQEN
jgi:diaminohydroxyphosphoribosylaminopyrimidine deaminase/5-amino-6-(5-phosphoribosylamino)uracil reductase